MTQGGNLGLGRCLDFQGHKYVFRSKFKCVPQSIWPNSFPGLHLDKRPCVVQGQRPQLIRQAIESFGLSFI